MALPEVIQVIEQSHQPLRSEADLSGLVSLLKDRKIVMLGESTHGTEEFYQLRKSISQLLIEEHGFQFVAVEGDWPPCRVVHQYLQGTGQSASARDALRAFHRWPTWMWANTVFLDFLERLRSANDSTLQGKKVGFHGLDVYSLFESADEVLKQLRLVNPLLERRARVLYECFGPFHRDERAYAKSLVDFPEGCQEQVLQVLQDLLRTRLANKGREVLFDAQQNARIVAHAEQYYRAMILGNEDAWNVRDRHMMETLNFLLEHYGEGAKGIVWAHNTHIGDYRATDMLKNQQVNIGGLAREQWGEEQVALVGCGTGHGEVLAARAWEGAVLKQPVPLGRPLSIEAAFHEVAQKTGNFELFLDLSSHRSGPLSEVVGHRAIGVVYNSAFERWGNYVPTSLARRYDAFVYLDQTRALTPLTQDFDRREIPETWPLGQ
jgi:erythromycin esterase